ncbi:PEP-CTERM sorting domain-containing protein [Nitrosovibrio sp. Nv4]|uniref:PEP-CTERM sorting domain-containing protein n=1 Tax=Nitrosovibrio sp. Nv4 TaxID=1945880 RepID=UPI000BC82C13|nr:PEP-CTERM sorting domain-containing protein [Nitrosovibrio sp. Nv4]SOD42072.1 PEP-CTERM protein-sorting domain-containing protein [Nitrosovibrio sp. Nv4]
MKVTPTATRNKFVTSALIGLGMALPLSASALTIDINTYVTGSPSSGTEATVATLILGQNGANVDFRLNNMVNNLAGNIGDDAYISQFFFSYSGSPVLTSASFLNFGGTQLINADDFGIDPSGKNAGYDFYLDLDYPTSFADRFVDGEFTTWTISNVSLDDFLVSVPGKGPASLAMVHIQQVGAGEGGDDSLKYVGSVGTPPVDVPQNPIPEPGSLALISLGLLGLGAMRKRKK